MIKGRITERVEFMQRKELRKAIKEYSNKTNFYKLSLVRRFIQSEEKEVKRLKDAIPMVNCPHCGSRKVSVEHSESEYSSDYWLYCDNCEETFDDDFGLKNALDELNYHAWSDEISVVLHFEKPNIKTESWKKFCEKELLRMLGASSDKYNGF